MTVDPACLKNTVCTVMTQVVPNTVPNAWMVLTELTWAVNPVTINAECAEV